MSQQWCRRRAVAAQTFFNGLIKRPKIILNLPKIQLHKKVVNIFMPALICNVNHCGQVRSGNQSRGRSQSRGRCRGRVRVSKLLGRCLIALSLSLLIPPLIKSYCRSVAEPWSTAVCSHFYCCSRKWHCPRRWRWRRWQWRSTMKMATRQQKARGQKGTALANRVPWLCVVWTSSKIVKESSTRAEIASRL